MFEVPQSDTEFLATIAIHGLFVIDRHRTERGNPKLHESSWQFLTQYLAHLADPTYYATYQVARKEDEQLAVLLSRLAPEATRLQLQASILSRDEYGSTT